MYDKTIKVVKKAYKKQSKKVAKTAKRVLEAQKKAMKNAVASNLKTSRSTKKKIAKVTKSTTQKLIDQVNKKKEALTKRTNGSQETKSPKKYPTNIKLSKEFMIAVIQPLKAANSKKMPLEDSWKKVVKEFKILASVSTLIPKSESIRETKLAIANLNKTLKKHFSSGQPYFDHMQMTVVNQSFEALQNQMSISFSILDRWEKSKSAKMKSKSKVPAVSLALLGALMRYWIKITDSKSKIISNGNHPGGIYLQRVLQTYFNINTTNAELQKLLDMTYASFYAQIVVKKKQTESIKQKAIADHKKRSTWLLNPKY